MTFLEAQRAARRGGHRLVHTVRTPNGLYRMLVCERCGGKILARTRDEAGGDIAAWSYTPREARENDRYRWIQI
jgi:DNA-directed RNA polymerase subunit RPC12/RpoP